VQAHDERALHGLARVQSIFLVVDGPDRKAINRNNASDLCLVALTQALQKEQFTVTSSRATADAEMLFTGGYTTIVEGSPSKIGRARLSYAVVVKDKNGAMLWSMVDDSKGDSIADACETAAEDIASEFEEAHDEALDD
jgi:hypothetical protein